MEKNQKKNKKINKKKMLIMGSLLIAVLVVVVLVAANIKRVYEIKFTKEYNKAVKSYNLTLEEYGRILENCSIENINGMAIDEKLSIVSEEPEDISDSVEGGNAIGKIKKDTETILKLENKVRILIKIASQIVAPEQVWIAERLAKIDGISEMGAVTEETDINAMIGKEGGYLSCIYFGLSDIEVTTINGETIVEKGTDAGGAIEVYATVEDAKARCEYLSEYENTLLYSGSYAIVGTLVVRTSYKLTPQEQLDLTDIITKEFTKIY